MPSQPAAPVCQAINHDSAVISWDTPDGNGSPVTDYQCQLDDGMGGGFQLMYTGPDPSCNVNGLKARNVALESHS